MRVFVVGTGRCGSTTFAEACSHATNYTSAHESKAGTHYDLEYPDDHIEVDPPLIFQAKRLRERYPDAKWVWLVRDESKVVDSIVENDSKMASHFAAMCWHKPDATPRPGAELLVRVMLDLCSELLPKDTYILNVEDVAEKWPECWRWMGCKGSIKSSMKEWNVRYNATIG